MLVKFMTVKEKNLSVRLHQKIKAQCKIMVLPKWGVLIKPAERVNFGKEIDS